MQSNNKDYSNLCPVIWRQDSVHNSADIINLAWHTVISLGHRMEPNVWILNHFFLYLLVQHRFFFCSLHILKMAWLENISDLNMSIFIFLFLPAKYLIQTLFWYMLVFFKIWRCPLSNSKQVTLKINVKKEQHWNIYKIIISCFFFFLICMFINHFDWLVF